MVEFLLVRRWEKQNRSNFYWVMVLECMQLESIGTWYSSSSLQTSNHFVIKIHTWRFDIVQNFSCLTFGTFCTKMYTKII